MVFYCFYLFFFMVVLKNNYINMDKYQNKVLYIKIIFKILTDINLSM